MTREREGREGNGAHAPIRPPEGRLRGGLAEARGEPRGGGDPERVEHDPVSERGARERAGLLPGDPQPRAERELRARAERGGGRGLGLGAVPVSVREVFVSVRVVVVVVVRMVVVVVGEGVRVRVRVRV